MIKTIIFDLGGVLIDLDMQRCFQNVKALGMDFEALAKPLPNDSADNVATICDGVSASGIIHLYQIGGVSTNDFIHSMQKICNPACAVHGRSATYQEVLEAWNSCLLTIPQYKLDFIKELRAEGYNTYLLSNTNDAHWRYMSENSFPEPVDEYFDKLFLSQELHLAKPNPEIYKAVLERIPTPANECLFIDDSKVNCEAAEALEIQTYNAPVRTDFRAEVKRLIRSLV